MGSEGLFSEQLRGQLRKEAQEAIYPSLVNHCSGDLGLEVVPQPRGREDGRQFHKSHSHE